ncbi:MAG: short chain dehydrogenase [Nitrospinaceae bacterium]|nr:MAG: short chain dehydrogenase [Nitrospinaceae bacterium]
MPTAIITGGRIRLGSAMALHLAKKGYDIALHHRTSGESAVGTIAEIRAAGVKCEPFACDFTDLAAVESLIEMIVSRFTDIELLVNSAANFIQEDIEHTTTKTMLDTFHINLLAPYLMMREYKKHVNRGMIVNILDERISRNVPTFAAYSVAKVGLAHLTHLASIEWGATVRVNGIAPGLILPPQGGAEDYLARGKSLIPTLTHGTVEDICRGLDYLLESSFVNGETLFIDGGQSKGWARKQKGEKSTPPEDPSWLNGGI